jgi:signal transduction histidine kinase
MNNGQPAINILMVDDEPSNLLALEVGLEDLGQNLIKASSGGEALRHLLEKDFGLILLDVQMPGLNGFETAVAIRERERSRHIPIIFLTGRDKTEEMIFQGYSAGAVDYLVKPLQMNVLRAKVSIFVELAVVRQNLQREIQARTRIAAEISQLNEELQRKNEELQKTVQELESYSYSISHDMRSPLRAMQGYAEILLEEATPLLTEEHQGFLRRIDSGASRLDQLIQDVLSYSVLARAKFKLEPVDLDSLSHEVVEQYPGLQAPAVQIEIPQRLPQVLAHTAMLSQCVSNLLGNAIKFVAPGVQPRIVITAERQGRQTVVSFQDNGIGIAPRDLERIFGIFARVHSSESYAGTGIGLSIVRKAVEKMGGQVGVTSEVGKGSRFWLQLQTANR